MNRKDYTMTNDELDELLDACKPVPYIIVGGVAPRSQQERANDAWARLGKKLGFDSNTVKPTGRGNRSFSAVPVEILGE